MIMMNLKLNIFVSGSWNRLSGCFCLFCPNILERWWGPMNGTLSLYEYRLSGGDAGILSAVIEFI